MNILEANIGFLAPPDLIVVAILVLILFGWRKLPTFGRSLGRSIGEFRRAKEEFEEELWRSQDARALKDKRRHPHGENRCQSPNELVYLMMIISAILLMIGLCRWLDW